ncbi:MAG: HD domain-containing protein [Clostridia bacterium]|nr:HD domain-containing protein [Clostridia bacterium]
MSNFRGPVRRAKKGTVPVILFCAACILLNFLGVRLALFLKLPMYLDSVGTVLASALGGLVPGIAVGFLTNMINGLFDYTTLYYGVISILIALTVYLFARRDGLKTWKGKILCTLLLILIGGGLGSVLTFLLYGGGLGDGISAPLVSWMLSKGMGNVFEVQLYVDLGIDTLDKIVTMTLACVALHFLGSDALQHFNYLDWRHLDRDMYGKEERKHFTRKLSVEGKISVFIICATLVIALVVTWITYHQFNETIVQLQSEKVQGVARLVASIVDPEKVDTYLAEGEQAEGYTETFNRLQKIRDELPDIEYLYVYQIREDGCHVVFDTDADGLEGEVAGTVVPFDESFSDVLPTLLSGGRIDPMISDDAYGWLLTAYEPVLDADGRCVCYAAADVSMPKLVSNEQVFLVRTLSLFTGFFVLLLSIGIYLAKYFLAMPVNAMAMAADAFVYDSEEGRSGTLKKIKALDIHTGDEIENLYGSLMKTTEDSVRYITDAQKNAEKLQRLQNGMIMVLADLVESRDQTTGAHVRKTAMYCRIIMEQMRREGTYRDILTDEFMDDVEHSAPLHDIGKIIVPDAVLNKPGRLTDEEFAKMKEHTSAGEKIIHDAMKAVAEEDSGYLMEACNLAEHHHEKWNGTGYPEGLKGEEIPLSARIMAVADVFDALVSRRSYKEPFPIDQAMDIIREGAGSHFDPAVAEAFLHAEDQVRKVAEFNLSQEEQA